MSYRYERRLRLLASSVAGVEDLGEARRRRALVEVLEHGIGPAPIGMPPTVGGKCARCGGVGEHDCREYSP